MVRFLFISIYKACVPLTGCKPNVEPRGIIMHQKMNVLRFLLCVKKGHLRGKFKFDCSCVFSCPHLLFLKFI